MNQPYNLQEEEDRMCKAILEKYSFYNLKNFYDYEQCDESEVNMLNKYFHDNFKFWDLESSGNEASLPNFVIDQNAPKQNLTPISVSYPMNEFQDKEIQDFNFYKMKREKYLVLDSRQEIKFQKPRKAMTMSQISQINETGSFIAYIEPNLYQEWQVRKSIYYGKKRCYEKIKTQLHNIKQNLKRIIQKVWTEGDFKSIISSKKLRQLTLIDVQEDFSNLSILDGIRHIFHSSIQLLELFIGFPIFLYDYFEIKRQKERVFQQRIEAKVKQNPDKYIELSFINRLLKDPSIFTSSTLNFNEVKEVLNIVSQIEDGQLKLQSTLFNSSELTDKILERITQTFTPFLLEKDFNQAEIDNLLNHIKGEYILSKVIYDNQYKTDRAKVNAILQALKRHKLNKQYELVKLISNETLSGLSLLEKTRIYSENKVFIEPLNKFCVKNVDRQTYFWKFQVYFYECNNITSKSFGSLFNLIFKSKYGLKNLLCFGDGYVPSESQNISNQVSQNYKSFNEEGDGGFFSNRIGKVVLFLHNRIINQFLYQFLMVNIFLRVFYLFISLILLMLLPFALFVWVLCLPLALLKIISMIFFYDGSVPSDDKYSYPVYFPIFQILFRICFRGMLQIFICPFLMFFYAIKIVGNLFICFLIIPRRLLDYFTFCILTCNGRVPRKDSYSAKKIREKIIVFKDEENEGLQQQRYKMQEGEQKISKGYQYTFDQVKEMIDTKVERILTKYYINFQKNKVDQLYDDNNKKLLGILANSPFGFEDNKITNQMSTLKNAANANLDYTYKEKLQKNLQKIPDSKDNTYAYPYSEALTLFLQVQFYLSEKFSPSSTYTWILWQKYKLQQFDYQGLTEKLLSKIFGPANYSSVFAHILMTNKNISKYDQLLINQINKYFKEQYHFIYFFNNYQLFSFSRCIQRIFNKQASNQDLLTFEPQDWLLVKVDKLQN